MLVLESRASDVVDRSMQQGFLSKYMPSGFVALKRSKSDYESTYGTYHNRLALQGPATDAIQYLNANRDHGETSLALAEARAKPLTSNKDFVQPKMAERE